MRRLRCIRGPVRARVRVGLGLVVCRKTNTETGRPAVRGETEGASIACGLVVVDDLGTEPSVKADRLGNVALIRKLVHYVAGKLKQE